MDALKKARLFQQGLEAFNSRHFYEAHEHWEEVWLETQNPEKRFLQGLIQIAAGFHHHSRANRQGCLNLLRAGLFKLEAFPKNHRGIAIEPLRATTREWIATLAAGTIPAGEQTPQIQNCREGNISD